MNKAKSAVIGLLDTIDVRIGGDRPWDVAIHDERFYERILAGGSLALGESYMDGWWDSESIDGLIARVLGANIAASIRPSASLILALAKARLFNRQNSRRAYRIAERHYDLGNDLYSRMLDRRMNYSCAYWKDAVDLDSAQEAKLDLICRKLGLEPGMRVLDIGCGWGGLARFAAERYGVSVVGITVSVEQAALARELCAGLPVEIRLQDYRLVNEKFDRVVSVGMVEHVGYKNYPTFMRVAARCLAPDGLFLLHTIGSNRSAHFGEAWLDRYIFPDGMLPSVRQLAAASEGLFRMEDWHNFGPDYDLTLLAWHKNFRASWDSISHLYDQRFYRMWTYYLLMCAGSFRARHNQLWQIVYSPVRGTKPYRSLR